MKIQPNDLRRIIYEEITSSDRKDIRSMIDKEIDKALRSRETKKMIQDEIEIVLKKSETKKSMGDIVKKVLKRLYRDMSVQHPYMIDRVSI